MRRTPLVLVGMLLCAAAAEAQNVPAQAQNVPSQARNGPPKIIVEDVVPQGNRLVSSQKIMGLIKTRPGSEYLPEMVQEDVRKLSESHLFSNVQAIKQPTGENKVKIYFHVAEFTSTIQEIVYKGAKHLKPDELETLTGLRKGAPLNPIANRMAVNAIQRRYEEMGRLFAAVELVEGNKPGDTRVVFNITEGPVIHVSGISFVGNTFVSGARLKTQVDSSSEFLHLFGGRFDPSMADHDVTKLEEYYKRYGFQDVHVSREFQWDQDYDHVRLVFHIREGPHYRTATIQVEGNKILTEDLLLSQCKLRPGEFYSKDRAEADSQLIQAIYGNRGYGVTVREQDFSTAPGEVAVHYEVQEKPPAKVGEIRVVGNDVTRQNVILRQVPLYPGQPLTYPDLRVAERNLAKLGIFETNAQSGVRPTVSVTDLESDTEFKDILVQVQETPTGSLIFGLGVNSDAGLTGSVVLNERNFDIMRWPTSFEDLLSGHAFRGGGQEFRLEAVPGTQLQRYTASWREPYLFDSQYSLGLSAYYWDRVYNEYTESRLGTRAVVSRRLNQLWSASVTGRIEEVGISNVQFFEPSDFQQVHGTHFLSSLRFGVTRDSRDSYLRATEGSLMDVSFEQFLGDYNFPQLNFEFNKYWTVYERADLSGRHVLAAHSQVSWTSSHTPVFERFYAGGFRSMRGFEFRGVGPAIDGFELGGDFLFLNSLEYQVPILANDNLYAVVFCDTGTVESKVEIKDYRVAVGAGLRIVVPMMGPVPIALDLGFPINKGRTDHEQVFSFWVGFFH
jgi:outer membrane protein assembly complex protein YaeT